MKRIVSLFMILFILISMPGCFFHVENPFPYLGKYKELYTTAIYSIPDVKGYMKHGEGAYSSDIYIWEQDNYGRTLFAYCEDYSNMIFGLVVCQTYDESNVYFYPDVNYVLTRMNFDSVYENKDDNHLRDRTEEFYLENKEKLKEENDWNKPIDKNKCASYPITDHKVLGKDSLNSVQCNEILNEYSETLNLSNPDNTPHRYNKILQVDAEGKILHEIRGVHQYHDNPNWSKGDKYTSYSIVLWVITDKKGNYDKDNGMMVMYSKANEPDKVFIYDAKDILEFKNRNGWINNK